MFANLLLATCTLAIIIFPSAENMALVQTGRFVPVFFFEVITGVWLLVKGVRELAAAEPANVRVKHAL
jgi:hypothetical protein